MKRVYSRDQMKHNKMSNQFILESWLVLVAEQE